MSVTADHLIKDSLDQGRDAWQWIYAAHPPKLDTDTDYRDLWYAKLALGALTGMVAASLAELHRVDPARADALASNITTMLDADSALPEWIYEAREAIDAGQPVPPLPDLRDEADQ